MEEHGSGATLSAELSVARSLETLLAILTEVGEADSPEDAVLATLRGALRLVGGFRALAHVYDTDAGVTLFMRVEAQAGGAAALVSHERVSGPPTPDTSAWRLLNGAPGFIMEDAQALDPAVYPRAAMAVLSGRRAAVTVPIVAGGRPIGSLHIDHQSAGAYQPAHLGLAQLLAERTGAVIRRAQRQERAQRRQERFAETLAQVGAAADAEQALLLLLRGAVALLGGSSGFARLAEPGTGEQVLGLDLRADGTLHRITGRDRLPAGTYGAAVLAGGPAARVGDFRELDPAVFPYYAALEEQGVRSAVAVPVDADGTRIGALHVNHHEPHHFDRTDLVLAEALAARAGGAIERARRDAALRTHAARQARLEGAQLAARGVVHDLNNGLAPLSGYSELLSLHPAVRGDAQLATYAGLIHDGAQQLAGKVARLQRIVRLQEVPPEMAGGADPVLDLDRSTSPEA